MTEDRYEHIVHPFPPLYDEESRILILGSLPSVKSREQMFFYGHPQNRFWKVISRVLGEKLPVTIDDKKAMLHAHHIALWDAIYSCDIIGSSDSSIKNVTPTDLSKIVEASKVTKVICNGKTSGKYYAKYQQKILGIEPVVLPSRFPNLLVNGTSGIALRFQWISWLTSGVLRYRIYANYRQKINSYITFSKAFCRMMYNE